MSGTFSSGRSILVAAALASLFATGAEATTTKPVATSAAAVAGTSAMQLAAVICGGNGCAPVQTKPQQKRNLKPLGHG
jgi:hypothetical protein